MKKLLHTALMLTPLLAPMAATATPQAEPIRVSAQAAKAKGIWIDVRTPQEFSQGHLKNAVNIPVEQISRRIRAASPDKNAPVNLYCRSGHRAEAALRTLKSLGYTNITNYGGYQDLLAKGIR